SEESVDWRLASVHRRNPSAAPETHGFVEQRTGIVRLDIEGHEAPPVLARADAAVDARALGLGVDHSVALRIVGIDTPPEEVLVELLRRRSALRVDLELRDRIYHDRLPFVSASCRMDSTLDV